MSKIKSLLGKIAHALGSKEARGPELALARIVIAAAGIKFGFDFSKFLGA